MSMYYTAHPSTEAYGGIPGIAIGESAPTRLEGLVENEGFADQPNEFPTLKIAIELSAPRARPRDSASWRALEAGALESGIFPIPFSRVSAADPSKVRVVAAAYKKAVGLARRGESAPTLPIPEDLYDPDARVMAGVVPPEGATGKEIAERMCRRCHNGTLDQTVSRALFNVDALDTMSPDEIDKAIERMRLPETSRRKMPPVRAGSLDDADIAKVEAYFRSIGRAPATRG